MGMQFVDLARQYREYKDAIDASIRGNIERTSFIGGDGKKLEETLAAYVGVKHGIGCGSGTDALLLPLLAIGIQPGDEVITTPFTFIATAEVIAFIGAKPVFVDIDESTYNIDVKKIEAAVTKRTKAMIPVSLYGQAADMDAINAIAAEHRLVVIEDAAQSFGAVYKGRKSCALSAVAATSFFPSKPLGAYGDAGMAFTNDDDIAAKMRSLLNHGQTERYVHKYIGLNFRLDSIQAGILLAKFGGFEKEAESRARIGKRYTELLAGAPLITPKLAPYTDRSVFAQYSVRVKGREKVIAHLTSKGIPTAVHYPIPVHLQEAYRTKEYGEGSMPVSEMVAREIMSVPMHAFLTDDEQRTVADALREAVTV